MYPHRIRLHGPWEARPIVGTRIGPDGRVEEIAGPVPARAQLRLPQADAAEPFGEFRGRVLWQRRFHAPRTLEADERLWLAFDGVDYFADVSLNGTPLGRHEGCYEPFDMEITRLVRPRNELSVLVDCPVESNDCMQCMIRGGRTLNPPRGGGIRRSVRLEVRSFACLRDLQCTAARDGPRGVVTVSGRVAGEPLAPLRVHLSVNDRAGSELPVDASPAGSPFRVQAAIDAAPWWPRPIGEPATYRVTIELHGRARTADSKCFRVGFPAIVFDPDLKRARIHSRDVGLEIVTIPPGGTAIDAERILRDCVPHGRETVALVRSELNDPEFYEFADRTGVLILQQLPLNGGYATGPEFRANACRQVGAIVRGLVHHPSIGAWVCHANPGPADQPLDVELRRTIQSIDPSRGFAS